MVQRRAPELNFANSHPTGELTGDLERLIGRKPITTAEFLRDNYPMVVPQIEAAKANKAG